MEIVFDAKRHRQLLQIRRHAEVPAFKHMMNTAPELEKMRKNIGETGFHPAWGNNAWICTNDAPWTVLELLGQDLQLDKFKMWIDMSDFEILTQALKRHLKQKERPMLKNVLWQCDESFAQASRGSMEEVEPEASDVAADKSGAATYEEVGPEASDAAADDDLEVNGGIVLLKQNRGTFMQII